jgi:hypothetical protein
LLAWISKSSLKQLLDIARLDFQIQSKTITRTLLAWIVKSRLKQGKYPLEIAGFGNLAEPEGDCLISQ